MWQSQKERSNMTTSPVDNIADTIAGLADFIKMLLEGQKRSVIEELMKRSYYFDYRLIGHGDRITAEFNPLRLNISFDENDIVKGVYIG